MIKFFHTIMDLNPKSSIMIFNPHKGQSITGKKKGKKTFNSAIYNFFFRPSHGNLHSWIKDLIHTAKISGSRSRLLHDYEITVLIVPKSLFMCMRIPIESSPNVETQRL